MYVWRSIKYNNQKIIYVYDINDAGASKIMAPYNAELDDIYVLYSGTISMNIGGLYHRIMNAGIIENPIQKPNIK